MFAGRIVSFCWAGVLVGLAFHSPTLLSQQENEQKQEVKPKLDYLGDPLPDRAIFRFGTRRLQHPSNVIQIILSKDESTVFSLSSQELIAWDVKSGKQLWNSQRARARGGFSAASYGVRPMAILPDTSELLTTGMYQSLYIYDSKTGKQKELKVGDRKSSYFRSVDVSPDGKLIAAGSARELVVVDRQGKTKFKLENKPKQSIERFDRDRMTFGGEYSYSRFSPDGKILAFSKSENLESVFLLNPETGKTIREIKTKGRVVRFDFSPDSKSLVVSERDIAARLYEVATGKQLWEFKIEPSNAAESYLSDITFRPDGKQVAVGAPLGSDYRIRVVDAANGKEVGAFLGCKWKPWTLEYSSDGKMLFASGWDSSIRRWDADSLKELMVEKAERASATCSITTDGKWIAYGVDTGEIRIVKGDSRERVRSLKHDKARFSQIRFSDDGKYLAAGGKSKDHVHVVVWDWQEDKILHQWNWAKGRDPHSDVEEISFSADGKHLAACMFRQSQVVAWNLDTGKKTVEGRHGNVYGVSFKPDGTNIVSVGWDRKIREWDLAESKESNTKDIPRKEKENGPQLDSRMYGVDHSPDGKLIAVADMSRRIRIHETENFRRIHTIRTDGSFVYGTLRVSNNGLWVAAGFTSGKVVIYDIRTGEEVWEYGKHVDHVYTVEFGANDSRLISGGSDGVCYLWNLGNVKADKKLLSQRIDELIFYDAKSAFEAYQHLAMNRHRHFAALEAKLKSLFKIEREFDESKYKKLTIGMGSTDEAVANKAKEAFQSLGLDAYSAICGSKDALSDDDTSPKSAVIRNRHRMLHSRINRVITFIAESDEPEAAKCLSNLMKSAPGTHWKKLIFQKMRERKRRTQKQ